MHRYGFGFMGIFGIIFWAIFIILAVWVISVGFKLFDKSNIIVEKRDRALEILKERYAKGEITKEEFEEMKSDLDIVQLLRFFVV
ncbi:SHOCT domain-containing protein [Deferribacter autotrophicus]|uniref:SHOCT domain-containing protein n=1 Tax=Deferribacter autotrophicus TaxID=500465 RepID=A0A5A8F063_9BACT|nr:SHOCT domain-containing protein [Deferribacter autotrophicus]KAA0257182.1 SHOCT domain-containing protein [Deferribacter autotrophicus]